MADSPTELPRDPDASLVASARQGDRRALDLLAARLRDRVFRFVLRRVGDPDAAEDLTQDTFVEVVTKLDRFRGASRFSTWVLGIALNLTRNHLTRSPQRRYRMEPETVLDAVPDRTAGPHDAARGHAFAAAVRAAFGELPAESAEALRLVALDGLEYRDAAALLGVPLGTMKTRVFRARRALREAMAAAGQDDFLDPD